MSTFGPVIMITGISLAWAGAAESTVFWWGVSLFAVGLINRLGLGEGLDGGLGLDGHAGQVAEQQRRGEVRAPRREGVDLRGAVELPEFPAAPSSVSSRSSLAKMGSR